MVHISRTETSVSPVVGVILMIALTVVFSATICVFVFNIGDSGKNEAFAALGVEAVRNGSRITATVVTGEADTLISSVDGVRASTLIAPSAGDTLAVSAMPGSMVTYVAVVDGDRAIVTTMVVPTTEPLPPIPTEGLIGHWKFNEPTTSTLVDSVNGYNGTQGTGVYTTGKHGTGLQFAVGTHAHIPEQSAFNSSHITIAVWVKPTIISDPDTYGHRVVSRMTHDTTLEGWELSVKRSYDSSLRSRLKPETGPTQGTNDAGNVTRGEWNLMVITYGPTYTEAYIDGTRIYSAETNGEPLSNGTKGIYLGTPALNPGSVKYSSDVTIDDVRVYDRLLSSDEVKALYVNTK